MHFETEKLYEGPPCEMCQRANFIGTCTHRPMKKPDWPAMPEIPVDVCPLCIRPIGDPAHQACAPKPPEPPPAPSLPEMLSELRGAGYMVGVHNDYKLHGQLKTFWLFTHPATGTFLKGEGLTDELAVKRVLDQVPAAHRPDGRS